MVGTGGQARNGQLDTSSDSSVGLTQSAWHRQDVGTSSSTLPCLHPSQAHTVVCFSKLEANSLQDDTITQQDLFP